MRCLFRRDLPRGGFVAAELVDAHNPFGHPYSGRVVVERRASAARRVGHHHRRPVIAVAGARSIEALMAELYPIVDSDVSVTTRLRRLREAGG